MSGHIHISDEKPSSINGYNVTAHEKILEKTGWNIYDCVGGSIKLDGTIEFRSKSINEMNFGMTDISETDLARLIEMKINQMIKRRHHNDIHESYYNYGRSKSSYIYMYT
mgnify:FL=1